MPLVKRILPTIPTGIALQCRIAALKNVAVDVLLLTVSYVSAHLLRFGGLPPSSLLTTSTYALPLAIALKLGVFHHFRLWEGLWKHAGTPEAVRLVRATTASSGLFLLGLTLLPTGGPLPFALLFLDWLLTTVGLSLRRFGHRAVHRKSSSPASDSDHRILIYGTDEAGMLLLRYLRDVGPARCSVVGFLDPTHAGLQLRGLPVLDHPDAMDADELIVPVAASLNGQSRDRNPAQIFETYASAPIAHRQFEVSLCPSSQTAVEHEQA
jgi:UDP-GlcNAc:undecaprenyl-phosphate GlcNAc-1-phosphate transferase